MDFFKPVEPSFGFDELEKFSPVSKFIALYEQNRSIERKVFGDSLHTHVAANVLSEVSRGLLGARRSER